MQCIREPHTGGLEQYSTANIGSASTYREIQRNFSSVRECSTVRLDVVHIVEKTEPQMCSGQMMHPMKRHSGNMDQIYET